MSLVFWMKKMKTSNRFGGIWIFGDYRNYFRNRVTLQLIAKGKELAQKLNTQVAVIILGDQVHQYVMEYIAHGADIVIAGEHPYLKDYHVEAHTFLLSQWIEAFQPEIFIAGATSFGREFFPRLAKILNTGLSADCIALDIDQETRLLVQKTPAFGGELLADIITPETRPQMATIHPGIFKELPHDSKKTGKVIYPEVDILPQARLKIIRRRPQKKHTTGLENASVVIVGGIGLGSEAAFETLFELAGLLDAEVGATRPVILSGWTDESRLIGQTGKKISPSILISIGTSGALQYTSGIMGADTIIAINRDPDAPIFKIADLGLVGEISTFLPLLIETLRKRL